MALRLKESNEVIHALQENSLIALNFSADWAAPCKHLDEVFDELAKNFPHIKFFHISAEDFPDLSERYEVVAVPSFILLQGNNVVDRVDGANAAGLTKKVTALSEISPKTAPADSSAPKDLNTRLKELTHAAKCMVFMKGTPTEPRCGFSKQLIEILDKNSIEYSTFNILADEEVRLGLKTYSNWPTYPQIYVNGELVGGLDIIKELVKGNELTTTLPVKKTQSLEGRLKELINQAPIMVFIKGTPNEPRCGFSKKIVSLLKENEVKFSSFDILTDEDVRQGLKTYSNWPTYPQLYVKGELIGGLDIAQELVESGEFKNVVHE